MSRIGMLLLGASLALGFVIAARELAGAIGRFRQDNAIRVKGYAEKRIVANQATWTARVQVRDPDLKTASAQLDAGVARVGAFLAGHGVPAARQIWSAITTEEKFAPDEKGNATNQLEAYVLGRSVEIQSAEVEQIGQLARTVTDLLAEGIQVESRQPVFLNLDIEAIKLDLLGQATANGRERAEVLAKNSRGRVGPLISASQGVFQITPPDSTTVSDYGTYDTSTIGKLVKAVVTLEFASER